MRRLIPVLCLLMLACSQGTWKPMATGGTPQAELPGTAVRFETPDGITLAGRLFGTGPNGLVFSHMFPAPDARDWYPVAERLAADGYTGLAFSFRGYEGSGGRKDPSKAHVDVKAAADFLRSRGAGRIALIGASMGGTASLVVAASNPAAAVVAVSAPTSFRGVNAETSASNVRSAVLLLAASGDDSAATSLRSLSRLLPQSTAKLFDGMAHGTNLLADRPESVEELVAFVRTHLA